MKHIVLALTFGLASLCDAQAPASPFVVAANQRSGVATLVDLTSGKVSNVDLGLNPHEVAVSPDGRIAALTIPSQGLGAGRTVVVLDLATTKILRKIDIGRFKDPHGLAFLSDSVALVGTLGGTSLAYLDVKNGRVLRSVEGFAENPYIVKTTATGRAYVSSPHNSKVTEVDIASGRIARVLNIPDDPAGIAVSADGKELYAAVWRESGGGGVVIYDLEKRAVVTRLPATQPRRITLTPDEKTIVVSDREHVRIIDRATRSMRSVDVGPNAGGSGVACAPDSRLCYVALSQAGMILEIDIKAGSVLRRFAAERGVDGIAYVPR
jgi:DNA-binding beta-propeller fold protein YncE